MHTGDPRPLRNGAPSCLRRSQSTLGPAERRMWSQGSRRHCLAQPGSCCHLGRGRRLQKHCPGPLSFPRKAGQPGGGKPGGWDASSSPELRRRPEGVGVGQAGLSEQTAQLRIWSPDCRGHPVRTRRGRGEGRWRSRWWRTHRGEEEEGPVPGKDRTEAQDRPHALSTRTRLTRPVLPVAASGLSTDRGRQAQQRGTQGPDAPPAGHTAHGRRGGGSSQLPEVSAPEAAAIAAAQDDPS